MLLVKLPGKCLLVIKLSNLLDCLPCFTYLCAMWHISRSLFGKVGGEGRKKIYNLTKLCIFRELISNLIFVFQDYQHHLLLQHLLHDLNARVALQALLTLKRSAISTKTAKTTLTRILVAIHVISVKTCVAGVIPT